MEGRYAYITARGKRGMAKSLASAKAKAGLISGKANKSNPTKRKTGRNPMAKKKKNRKQRSFTIPMAVVGGVVAGVSPAIQKGLEGDWVGIMDKLAYGFAGVSGVNVGQPKLDLKGLKTGLLPVIIGAMVHIVASKLGINRALGRSRIPVIRI